MVIKRKGSRRVKGRGKGMKETERKIDSEASVKHHINNFQEVFFARGMHSCSSHIE